jgi:cell division protein FtsZ
MGGGTGTGAAPVVAKVAREKGVLTVGVVTKPFPFEGPKRMKAALAGINALREHVDSLVIIPNARLLAIAPKNAKLIEMLKKADDVLYGAVRGVTDLITKPGLINADFADVRTVMASRGMALMGEGRASGEGRAIEAAKRAISSPLLEDLSITGCKALLVNLTANADLGIDEYSEANSYIEEAARGQNGEGPEVVMAISVDENCGDEIRITVIATGIEDSTKPAATAKPVIVSNPATPEIDKPKRPRDPKTILTRPSDDTEMPAYLRYQDKAKDYQSSLDSFTIEEEDNPAFLKK